MATVVKAAMALVTLGLGAPTKAQVVKAVQWAQSQGMLRKATPSAAAYNASLIALLLTPGNHAHNMVAANAVAVHMGTPLNPPLTTSTASPTWQLATHGAGRYFANSRKNTFGVGGAAVNVAMLKCTTAAHKTWQACTPACVYACYIPQTNTWAHVLLRKGPGASNAPKRARTPKAPSNGPSSAASTPQATQAG